MQLKVFSVQCSRIYVLFNFTPRVRGSPISWSGSRSILPWKICVPGTLKLSNDGRFAGEAYFQVLAEPFIVLTLDLCIQNPPTYRKYIWLKVIIPIGSDCQCIVEFLTWTQGIVSLTTILIFHLVYLCSSGLQILHNDFNHVLLILIRNAGSLAVIPLNMVGAFEVITCNATWAWVSLTAYVESISQKN